MNEVKKDDIQTRDKILSGNIPKTILSIVLPLFLYYMLDNLYTLFDTFVLSLSHIGQVEGISYLSEIKRFITCFGAALVTGMSILVSQAIGAKDVKKANKCLTSTFWATIFLGAAVIFVFIGFGLPVLRLMNTPAEVIDTSYGYYTVVVLSVVMNYFNGIFIGVEKAKGKTRKILYLNLCVIAIKIGLSSILAFAGIPGINNTHFAWATIVAQGFLLIFSFTTLFSKKQTYRVQRGHFDNSILKLVLKLSLPILLGNMIFYIVKIFINSKIAATYGIACMTIWELLALIFSFTQMFSSAMNNTINTMMAQNYGSGNYTRAKKIYWWGLGMALLECFVVMIVLNIFKEPICRFMTQGDTLKYDLLLIFFAIQQFDYITLAVNDCSLGATNALGRTGASMFNQMFRTLILRIPTLFIMFDAMKLGVEAVPLLPTLTNIIPAIVVTITVIVLLKKIHLLKPPTEDKTPQSTSKFLAEYKNSRPKALVFDCDGTMINHKNKLTDKTYNAIKKAGKKYKIIIATGRCLIDEFMPAMEGRPLIFDYILACDGAIIYDLKNNVVVNHTDIPTEWVKNIIKKAKTYGINEVWLYTLDGKVVVNNGDLRGFPKHPIVKVNIKLKDMSKTQAFVDFVKENYLSMNIFIMRDSFSDELWASMSYRDVGKGQKLSKLLTLIGISPEDAIVFGDSFNDISMFKAVDTSVAMGNAVDELKALASDTTKSYKNDGVAYYLNKYINPSIKEK